MAFALPHRHARQLTVAEVVRGERPDRVLHGIRLPPAQVFQHAVGPVEVVRAPVESCQGADFRAQPVELRSGHSGRDRNNFLHLPAKPLLGAGSSQVGDDDGDLVGLSVVQLRAVDVLAHGGRVQAISCSRHACHVCGER
jgi:hypothetical protein